MKNQTPVSNQFNSASGNTFPPEVVADIQAIDQAPDNFEAVLSYGRVATDKVKEVLRAFYEIEKDFEEQVKSLAVLSEESLDYLHNIDADTADETVLERLEKFSEEVNGAAKAIREIVEAVKKLETASIAAADLSKSFLLAGGMDVPALYDEKYIPEADEKFKNSQKPEDGLYAENVRKRKDYLFDKVCVMEGQRAQLIIEKAKIRGLQEFAEGVLGACLEIHGMQKAGEEKLNKSLIEKDLLVFKNGLPYAIPVTKPPGFPIPPSPKSGSP